MLFRLGRGSRICPALGLRDINAVSLLLVRHLSYPFWRSAEFSNVGGCSIIALVRSKGNYVLRRVARAY